VCGIVGYVGLREAMPVLLEGLARLEYRGYDSAGVAVLSGDGAAVRFRAVGKLQNLSDRVRDEAPEGTLGVGHTRWATHGIPSEENAHPHTDSTGEVVVVHNGIVENYVDLKAELIARGSVFISQTDTEVIPHLIQEELRGGLNFPEAFRKAMLRLRGAHAVAVLWSRDPEQILCMRLGNAGGVVIGVGDGEAFLASDLSALLPFVSRVIFLAPGEMASLSSKGAKIMNLEGKTLLKRPRIIPRNSVVAEKEGHSHFMFKEIMEESRCATDALRGRVCFEPEGLVLPEVPFTRNEIQSFNRIVLTGMGTSLHAALVGQTMLEKLTGIPVSVENASEFRYRDPVVDHETLVVSIGQSGETVDTLVAMEEAKRKNSRVLAICNTEDSQATRLADGTIMMRAGLEVGVAATKTFVNSVVCLYMLGVHLGIHCGRMSSENLQEIVRGLTHLPDLLGQVLESITDYEMVARKFYERSNFLYIGRGILYPIAMEGALKLKEISYIHAEGMPAAEMKHGPLALVDSDTPVVAICLRDHMYGKMLGNVSEVQARGGTVIILGTRGDENLVSLTDHTLLIPEVPYLLSPVISVVPLQLLAYYIAKFRGCDVDRPRNLAKSVTVE
jgi:glucosamine--fructose-6-phosphate aminotransferase (isomerizing)